MLLNAFRSLFSNSQNRKARRSCSPQLLQLEGRIVPAHMELSDTYGLEGTDRYASVNTSSTVTLYDPNTGAETGRAVPFLGFTGAINVAWGDLNNDGVQEIFAAAGQGGGPAIAILNSQTGEVIKSFFAFDPAFRGGTSIAVKDFNKDGVPDIFAAAGQGGGPEIRIFDGSNLNVLRSFFAYAEDFLGGANVAAFDFNNDRIPEIVTGAGRGGAAHAKVFDGATNAIISQWYAYPTDFIGGMFVAAGDIGNDGTFEVVTGPGDGGKPVVAVWNALTGGLLTQFMAYAEDVTGGVRVGVVDGNSDGNADIVTSSGTVGGNGGAGGAGGVGSIPANSPLNFQGQLTGSTVSSHVKVFSFPGLEILFQFYNDGNPRNLREFIILRDSGLPPPGNSLILGDQLKLNT
jgi:hypothetical protein